MGCTRRPEGARPAEGAGAAARGQGARRRAHAGAAAGAGRQGAAGEGCQEGGAGRGGRRRRQGRQERQRQEVVAGVSGFVQEVSFLLLIWRNWLGLSWQLVIVRKLCVRAGTCRKICIAWIWKIWNAMRFYWCCHFALQVFCSKKKKDNKCNALISKITKRGNHGVGTLLCK